MRTALVVFFIASTMTLVSAEVPSALSPDHTSSDVRLGPPKTLNDHFPFIVPEDVGQWHRRAEMLRRRVLVATGLWPMPAREPIRAVIYGKSERPGFTVEKVYFESLPGHFVTGLLFRPDSSSLEKLPGVLCPHGHGGRMQRFNDAELESQLAQGAEHFRQSGRTPKLARCAQLARMGCVSFIFDMLGYADSVQIPMEVAHRHQDARPEEAEPTQSGWLFYSREADLRLQSIMGLQTWNALRALDFLASLPDVDPDRLAVTGGSGGGTQSILLGAIDDRIKVSFPNGMVSTSMQGGCYCENCNLLRVDTGNVELAALFAPRPQAMTAADDWTCDMMTDGYPQLKWLYAMIGDESDVYCRPMLNFKHNYNYVSRATMYQWMNRHLHLGLDDPVIEQDFVPLTSEETSVWSQDHPQPTDIGMDHERAITRWFDAQSHQQLSAASPMDETSLQTFRQVFGGAWQIIFDQGIPGDVSFVPSGEDTSLPGIQITKGLLRDPSRGTEIPLLNVTKVERNTGKPVVVWTLGSGKAAAFDQSGQPAALLTELLNQGAVVLLPDLIRQGEWGGNGHASGQRLVDDNRDYSAFSFGYNRTLVAERCADLLTVVAHAGDLAGGSEQEDRTVCLLATDQSVSWAAPAVALAGSMISRAALVVNGFRYRNANGYRDPQFVPGAVKYGDLPALLALRAPHALNVLGEQEMPELVTRAFDSAGAGQNLVLSDSADADTQTLNWLCK